MGELIFSNNPDGPKTISSGHQAKPGHNGVFPLSSFAENTRILMVLWSWRRLRKGSAHVLRVGIAALEGDFLNRIFGAFKKEAGIRFPGIVEVLHH